jgi:tetratricopeptide (TPR) repeat protein
MEFYLMPDLFSYWNVQPQQNFTRHDEYWLTFENTQNEATIRTSRESLYKLCIKYKDLNFATLLTEILEYLDYAIAFECYDDFERLLLNFKRKAFESQRYLNSDVLYFHPIHVARRALKELAMSMNFFNIQIDDDDQIFYVARTLTESEFFVAIFMYWGGASDSSTYSASYVKGDINRHGVNQEDLQIKVNNFRYAAPEQIGYKELCEHAVNLIKLGEYAQAVDILHSVVEINKYYPDAYYNLGIASAELENQILATQYFTRAHVEFKKKAFITALYEGQRGNNFNSEMVDTFAKDNFVVDNYVCHNGRVNKLAEYFVAFDLTHVTFDINTELRKAVETQVCLSYQRLYMADGLIKENAPELAYYCTTLTQHYINTKEDHGNIFTSAQQQINLEFNIIWDNIAQNFHGVYSENNPAGLLEYKQIDMLDDIAQNIEDLPLPASVRLDADKAIFDSIIKREFNFTPNTRRLNNLSAYKRDIRFILNKIKLSVVANCNDFPLTIGPAFTGYSELFMQNIAKLSAHEVDRQNRRVLAEPRNLNIYSNMVNPNHRLTVPNTFALQNTHASFSSRGFESHNDNFGNFSTRNTTGMFFATQDIATRMSVIHEDAVDTRVSVISPNAVNNIVSVVPTSYADPRVSVIDGMPLDNLSLEAIARININAASRRRRN